jgi:predicted ABC-type sugar transport system permease subunit
LEADGYGVAEGAAILCGGGGGVIRQSMNFQAPSTTNAVMIAATNCRVDVKLLRKGIYALRQTKVEISQAAFAVGCKHQSHLVKSNVDIRMMLFFLCHFGDGVNKIDRVSKIVEFERTLDVLFL